MQLHTQEIPTAMVACPNCGDTVHHWSHLHFTTWKECGSCGERVTMPNLPRYGELRDIAQLVAAIASRNVTGWQDELTDRQREIVAAFLLSPVDWA